MKNGTPQIQPEDVAAIKDGYDHIAPIVLRDLFAAAALMGLAAQDSTWTGIAEGAYAAADAMLAVRARKDGAS